MASWAPAAGLNMFTSSSSSSSSQPTAGLEKLVAISPVLHLEKIVLVILSNYRTEGVPALISLLKPIMVARTVLFSKWATDIELKKIRKYLQ